PAAPAANPHAQREKHCRAQADANGLHGKERKQSKAACLTG
ncbi:MAG: PsiF family protein, partial [Methylocystis sp.]